MVNLHCNVKISLLPMNRNVNTSLNSCHPTLFQGTIPLFYHLPNMYCRRDINASQKFVAHCHICLINKFARRVDALDCKPESQFISRFAMSVMTSNEYEVEAKVTLIGLTGLQCM